jgi:hypothetical protein
MAKKNNATPKDIYKWDINEWKEILKTLENIINSDKKPHEKKLALTNFIIDMTSKNSKIGKFNKKVESILNSKQKPWAKKLALFNLIKDLPIEEAPLEEKRENYLLESCLLNHLAKERMKKYKKVTAQSFSEEK